MCFEFGSCFGGGRRDDYGGERPNRNEAGGHRRGRRGNNNRNDYYAGADQKAAYHNRPPTAVDEAGHKAYHEGAGYPAYTQHKANVGTSKLPGDPAWHNKVGDDGYTGRLQAPAAMDYHHYPTTTPTALGRY
ncbi:hypothetical protein ACQJBY_073172 [Aegilops geniculata]